jgi:hypothetical protein
MEAEMIADLLLILVAGAGAGVLLAIQHRLHVRAELEADEAALTEVQELYAAWARLRAQSGEREPSGLDRRDRLPF